MTNEYTVEEIFQETVDNWKRDLAIAWRMYELNAPDETWEEVKQKLRDQNEYSFIIDSLGIDDEAAFIQACQELEL